MYISAACSIGAETPHVKYNKCCNINSGFYYSIKIIKLQYSHRKLYRASLIERIVGGDSPLIAYLSENVTINFKKIHLLTNKKSYKELFIQMYTKLCKHIHLILRMRMILRMGMGMIMIMKVKNPWRIFSPSSLVGRKIMQYRILFFDKRDRKVHTRIDLA